MSTAPALPHIVGSVAVRHFRDSDLSALYDIESDAFLKQFIHGGHVIASREDWIAKARGLCSSDFQFALEHVPSAQFMGRGTLGHYTLNNNAEHREVQVILAKPFLGRRLGRAACLALLSASFTFQRATSG